MLFQDLKYAVRMLRKNPGFTFVAILTLALGIGANTAIFTVIHAVLLRPLPYAKPQELVTWRGNESLLDVDDIRAQAGFFSAGGAVNPEAMDYTGGAEPLGVHAGYVDAGFFHVLGVTPMLGRTFSPEEDRRGGARAVVLGYQFWREYVSKDHFFRSTFFKSGQNSAPILPAKPNPRLRVPCRNPRRTVSRRSGYHRLDR
jgi:putative ABC transport system permease protein